MFHVGQRVRCVGTKNRRGRRAAFIRVGETYTIRAMYKTPLGRTIINLYEAVGPLNIKNRECGFEPFHFRPIVERKTSIAIFEAMLKGQPVEV